MRKNKELICLIIPVIAAAIVFGIFSYFNNRVVKEVPEKTSALEDWKLDESSLNNASYEEDKSIYPEKPDTNIYDVYLSVFPTEDETGELLNFASFEKHQSRDHSYNPILDCNVQILSEGKTPDMITNLDLANATIRVRGNSSRGDTYKSYKVKLSEDTGGFMGQYALNINKHSEDVCKISTKLCTDLLTDIDDIGSFQTYFMRLWIRDTSLSKSEQKFQYYGLYTEIEQPNKSYLEKRGLSSHGSIYKARDFSFQKDDVLRNVDDPAYDETSFETILGIREAKDHQALLEMINAVNDETRDFEDILNEYFNEDNYVTWLAFNLLLGNNDIINHNFLLYNPDNSRTWYFIPWDFDGTLQYGEYESSLMKLPPSLRGAQKLNQSILHRRFLRMPGSLQKVRDKMEELLTDDLTENRVKSLTDAYLPVLDKTMPLQPDIGLLEMPPSELGTYIDGLYGCIKGNYDEFVTAMEYPAPMYVALPVKNRDQTMHYSWEPSYSYEGRTITYHVTVADDYNMQNVVFSADNLTDTQVDSPQGLAPGIYYIKVTAVDSEGHEQLSMERYETMLTAVKGLNVNGVLQFKVE